MGILILIILAAIFNATSGEKIGIRKSGDQHVKNSVVIKNRNPQKVPLEDPCTVLGLNQLFILKHRIELKLKNALKGVQEDKGIHKATRERQIRAINLFRKEINETETLLYESIHSLQRVLKGDYKSLRNLERTSKQRLEELKKATLEEEQELNDILQAEKDEISELKKKGFDNVSKQNTPIRKFIDTLLADIASAADKLELQLDDGSFHKKYRSKTKKYGIETVLRLDEDDSQTSTDSNSVTMLIDSQNNQYVLSKPKDGTVTHVDSSLMKDIIYIIIFSLAFSIPCSWLKLPNLVAFILTGIVLGPSGINFLRCIVQIETLGEFGVFFILFVLGLEFSFEKIKQVWRTSFTAAIIIALLLNTIGLVIGTMFGINPRQSLFVATCLSMSSTPIMSKIMAVNSNQNRDHLTLESGEDYLNILAGIFLMQDVQIGLVMGILPILAGHFEQSKTSFVILPNQGVIHYWLHGASHAGSKDIVDSILTTFWSSLELILAILLITFISGFLATHFISRYFRLLNYIGKNEVGVVGTITIVFSMLLVTDHLGISMELGCFICGAVISSQGDQICKQASSYIEAIRDFFSCIFFASIGLHVFPAFVLSEIAIMIPITAMVVLFKFSVASVVLGYLLPEGSQSKWFVASGLLQISEFSFVLSSRARRFALISREVYLVILSVTMLSLVVGPFFWKIMTSKASWQTPFLSRILQFIPFLRKSF
ncbi:transmembrane and coiled-coil domain-containing protein 3-like [Rhopilema esculentum]|uniref:transmembrane and coiled-coil domain-containing protein 3-like n=1 Tax=Rhopilema esculentum TaxID=499914 RepID=UPI0031DC3B86